MQCDIFKCFSLRFESCWSQRNWSNLEVMTRFPPPSPAFTSLAIQSQLESESLISRFDLALPSPLPFLPSPVPPTNAALSRSRSSGSKTTRAAAAADADGVANWRRTPRFGTKRSEIRSFKRKFLYRGKKLSFKKRKIRRGRATVQQRRARLRLAAVAA